MSGASADCLHTVQLMPRHPKTPSPLASFKSRLVLPFWYRFAEVVLENTIRDACHEGVISIVTVRVL